MVSLTCEQVTGILGTQRIYNVINVSIIYGIRAIYGVNNVRSFHSVQVVCSVNNVTYLGIGGGISNVINVPLLYKYKASNVTYLIYFLVCFLV